MTNLTPSEHIQHLEKELRKHKREIKKLRTNQLAIRTVLEMSNTTNKYGVKKADSLTHYVRDEVNKMLIDQIDDCLSEIEHDNTYSDLDF